MGSLTALEVLLDRHSFPSHPLVTSSNITLTILSLVDLALNLTMNLSCLMSYLSSIFRHPSGIDSTTQIEKLMITSMARTPAEPVAIILSSCTYLPQYGLISSRFIGVSGLRSCVTCLPCSFVIEWAVT